jgi:hypothetical protein
MADLADLAGLDLRVDEMIGRHSPRIAIIPRLRRLFPEAHVVVVAVFS